MKSLAAGYFLSVVNALTLSPLGIFLLYVSLFTYPASIILRGLGWRRISTQFGGGFTTRHLLWPVGGITYVFVLLAFIQVLEYGIFIAVSTWTIYSVGEALLYIGAARRFGNRLFYVSTVNIMGVAVVDLLVSSIPLSPIRSGFPEQVYQMLYIASAALAVSAAAAGTASLKLTRQPPFLQPRNSALPIPSTTPIYQQSRVKAGRPLLQLKVVRRSEFIVCKKCRQANSVDAFQCVFCGYVFTKASTGLRCPVCETPFTAAKRIIDNRYLCGGCASTLEVVASRW